MGGWEGGDVTTSGLPEGLLLLLLFRVNGGRHDGGHARIVRQRQRQRGRRRRRLRRRGRADVGMGRRHQRQRHVGWSGWVGRQRRRAQSRQRRWRSYRSNRSQHGRRARRSGRNRRRVASAITAPHVGSVHQSGQSGRAGAGHATARRIDAFLLLAPVNTESREEKKEEEMNTRSLQSTPSSGRGGHCAHRPNEPVACPAFISLSRVMLEVIKTNIARDQPPDAVFVLNHSKTKKKTKTDSFFRFLSSVLPPRLGWRPLGFPNHCMTHRHHSKRFKHSK